MHKAHVPGGVATSRLAFAELASAFARRVRERTMSMEGCARSMEALREDFRLHRVMDVTDSVVEEAASLLLRHSLRAGDAVHLASASLLRRESGLTITFVTADVAQERAATAEGFSVLTFGSGAG